MRMLLCLCSVLLVAAAGLMADVDVAGKWTGSFVVDNGSGETHDSTALLILKQEGNTVTGTVGPSEDEQWPIKTGKVEGDKVTLEVQTDGPLITFNLVLSGEHLKGDAHGSRDGQNLTAKLDTTRAK